jgi:tRNA (guanine-N7-)-methyltransferase
MSLPSNKSPNKFRIRSFVRRDGRRTAAQENAYAELWPRFGLSLENGMLDLGQLFGNDAPCLLEIGFGMGQSLLAAAIANPDKNFIGVETHRPGIGALLLGVELNELTNIRVFHTDVIDVLEKCIPNASLAGIQIFFPDPWQKRKHHGRRLIQPEFLKLITSKLKPDAELHLATDWDDYAVHMMKVVSAETALVNVAGVGQFAERSPYRPIVSKFEGRAIREGRKIWELRLQRLALA